MSDKLSRERLEEIHRCLSTGIDTSPSECCATCSWRSNNCDWDAALLSHISALEAENERLRECHESELGVCQQHCDVVLHLEAENERLRWALGTIAYDTSLSVPLGQEPEAHYRMMTGSCISTAANALSALDEEATDEPR